MRCVASNGENAETRYADRSLGVTPRSENAGDIFSLLSDSEDNTETLDPEDRVARKESKVAAESDTSNEGRTNLLQSLRRGNLDLGLGYDDDDDFDTAFNNTLGFGDPSLQLESVDDDDDSFNDDF